MVVLIYFSLLSLSNDSYTKNGNRSASWLLKQNLTWQLFRAKSAPYQTEAVTLNRDVPIFQRPSQYLFEVEDQDWCVGFQDSELQSQGKKITLLGGSSSIKVKDEESGNVYSVGAHNLSPADRMSTSTGIAVSCFMFLLMAKLH
ncbi:hypothetical protein Tco_0059232 [Tanacetum coccineum]